jgi:hypothetical protein
MAEFPKSQQAFGWDVGSAGWDFWPPEMTNDTELRAKNEELEREKERREANDSTRKKR